MARSGIVIRVGRADLARDSSPNLLGGLGAEHGIGTLVLLAGDPSVAGVALMGEHLRKVFLLKSSKHQGPSIAVTIAHCIGEVHIPGNFPVGRR